MARRKTSRSKAESFGAEPGQGDTNQRFGLALVWAIGGAIIFTLPILMTLEMWQLGFVMSGPRLALFTVLAIPMLAGLSYYAGFEETRFLIDDGVDAFVAYAVGFVTAAFILPLFGAITLEMSARELVGKLALQAIPGSIGALLARDLMSGNKPDEERRRRWSRYGGQLFIMAVGAIFLSFNLAPTEEIVLIAHTIGSGHALLLMLVTLLIMHAFISSKKRREQSEEMTAVPWWGLLVRFTLVGYALALIMSGYILWSFGRLEGIGLEEMSKILIVLGFPAGIGAAASQLLL